MIIVLKIIIYRSNKATEVIIKSKREKEELFNACLYC